VIGLCVITDGRRECIARTIPSALASLKGPITYQVIIDDSADWDYGVWLRAMFPTFDVVHSVRRQGFGGAIRTAWAHLSHRDERFIVHIEDDFTFERPVDLLAMAEILDWYPHLAQLVLRRQPWNAQEKAAGGIVEQHPDDYVDCSDGDHHWLEHRRFFSTNPCLYRMDLCRRYAWPTGAESEGRFTHWLLEDDPGVRFAFWGKRTDSPWVTHIGDHRNGNGY
jgi:hypothetical protein